MGFFFLVVYLIAFYIRPGELYPSLAPYRIMGILGVVAAVACLFSLLIGERPTFRAPQIYLMAAFLGVVMFSQVAPGEGT